MNIEGHLSTVVDQVFAGLILLAVPGALLWGKKRMVGIRNAMRASMMRILKTPWRLLFLAPELVGMWVGTHFFVHAVAEPHVADTAFVFQAFAAIALAMISWIGFVITVAYIRNGR